MNKVLNFVSSGARYELNVVGLLGILVQAKNYNFIAAVKPLMDRLIQEADFRVSPELYRLILKVAVEEI